MCGHHFRHLSEAQSGVWRVDHSHRPYASVCLFVRLLFVHYFVKENRQMLDDLMREFTEMLRQKNSTLLQSLDF